MKKRTVFSFTWGSLPSDALSSQTMRELQVIAIRERTSLEQVMSKALDWILARPEGTSARTPN
jgi:hypothetical protein